jgi:hypothetical protein
MVRRPIKVNEKCQFYRDQRIGIDLVSDEFEIELGKELQMLTTVINSNSAEVLDNAYAALVGASHTHLRMRMHAHMHTHTHTRTHVH